MSLSPGAVLEIVDELVKRITMAISSVYNERMADLRRCLSLSSRQGKVVTSWHEDFANAIEQKRQHEQDTIEP